MPIVRVVTKAFKTWVRDGFTYQECPDCGRTHRCVPAESGEETPVIREPKAFLPSANDTEYEMDLAAIEAEVAAIGPGDKIEFLHRTMGNAQFGEQVEISPGDKAEVIDKREMPGGRIRLWVTHFASGKDVWVGPHFARRIE